MKSERNVKACDRFLLLLATSLIKFKSFFNSLVTEIAKTKIPSASDTSAATDMKNPIVHMYWMETATK